MNSVSSVHSVVQSLSIVQSTPMNKLFDVNPEEATRLVLVRHGRTASNAAGRIQGRADVPLDPTGLDEAHAVARALQRFGATALYTSPLSRARETAAIIGRELNLAPQMWDDLTEYDFGLMSERDLEEIATLDPRLYAELDALAGGGPRTTRCCAPTSPAPNRWTRSPRASPRSGCMSSPRTVAGRPSR